MQVMRLSTLPLLVLVVRNVVATGLPRERRLGLRTPTLSGQHDHGSPQKAAPSRHYNSRALLDNVMASSNEQENDTNPLLLYHGIRNGQSCVKLAELTGRLAERK